MYKVLVLPGDGVGPEIMSEARKVLTKVAQMAHLVFETKEAFVGGASIDQIGAPISDEVLREAKASDAVLLGAVGGPFLRFGSLVMSIPRGSQAAFTLLRFCSLTARSESSLPGIT